MSTPLCQWCMRRPAQVLHVNRMFDAFAYFCSLRCAACQAIDTTSTSRSEWCNNHECWYADACELCATNVDD